MISGASEQELANARANIVMKLDNTSTYESWLIIDTHLEQLEKENQELKKHLKVPEICNLKTLEDYKSYYEDTKREQILADTYIEYCAYVNLAHRYSELKKQLEEEYFKLSRESIEYTIKLHKNKVQQKEFIKYLEDEINKCQSNIFADGVKYGFQLSLSKYKKIIGVLDDKESKEN